jgi:nucleoside phosphorylase
MLKVLIVDDDTTKQAKIEAVVREHVFCELDIHIARDQASALRELRDNWFDLLILDINLPLNSKERRPIADGGIKLLKAIDKHKDFKTPQHIVGLTAFEELAKKHNTLFGNSMRFLITYKPNESSWRSKLSALVVNVVSAKHVGDAADFETDLVVLTALQTPELDAVLKIDAGWHPLQQAPGEAFCFHRGTFVNGEQALSVVAASATRMGMPAATVLASQAIGRFRPRYLAMAGIAAGVKGQFGDVLVADRTWDYGSGKSKTVGRFIKRTHFEPDPHQISTDDGLLSRIALFRSQRGEFMSQLVSDWPGNINHLPQIRIGPVASGAAVLENRALIEAIKKGNRKLIGIEMETYGVYLAAALAPNPRPVVFSAKAICDFGDSKKGDDMQAFASFVSASFVLAFASEHLCARPVKGH